MRGNPVMKSKRVTGPTPNQQLLTNVRLERCSVPGCENEVMVTRNFSMDRKRRECIDHVDGSTEVIPRVSADIRAEMWWTK
jgi:hypothetical protein